MQESRTPNYSRKGSWQQLQDHWGYHPKLLPHQDVSRPANPRKTPSTQCEKDIFWWFSTKAYLPHRKKLWGLACCWISGSKPGRWLVEKSKVSGCLLVHSQKQFEQLSKIKIEPATPRQNDSPKKCSQWKTTVQQKDDMGILIDKLWRAMVNFLGMCLKTWPLQ